VGRDIWKKAAAAAAAVAAAQSDLDEWDLGGLTSDGRMGNVRRCGTYLAGCRFRVSRPTMRRGDDLLISAVATRRTCVAGL
jgi:hypothetical protein